MQWTGLTWCGIWILILIACNHADQEKKSTGDKSSELTQLSQAIQQHPSVAEGYFKRGQYYHRLRQDSLALEDLYRACKIDSTRSTYYSSIADILFEHKDISASIQWIQKAIRLNPDDSKAHLKIAKLFFYTAEYPKAFTEINTVLRTDVYNAEAYFLKGMCYKELKDTNRAISGFQTAVQTDPAYADAYMQLGLLYKAKNNPLAISYFENAYKADTASMEPLYGEAMFWQDRQQYAEAKKVFRRCVLINPQYERAYYNTGWMLLQEDSTEKAIRQFSMAIGAKADYVEAYYNRGLCYEIRGKADSAVLDYKQALLLNEDFKPAQTALQRVSSSVKK